MAKQELIEEFHISVFVPRGLTGTEVRAIRRTLLSERFRARLGRAVAELLHQYPSLSMSRVTVTC